MTPQLGTFQGKGTSRREPTCCYEIAGRTELTCHILLNINRNNFKYTADLILNKDDDKQVNCVDYSTFGDGDLPKLCADFEVSPGTACGHSVNLDDQNLDPRLWTTPTSNPPEFADSQTDYVIMLRLFFHRWHYGEPNGGFSTLPIGATPPGKLCCDCVYPCAKERDLPWAFDLSLDGLAGQQVGGYQPKCAFAGKHDQLSCQTAGVMDAGTVEDLADGLQEGSGGFGSQGSTFGFVQGDTWQALFTTLRGSLWNMIAYQDVLKNSINSDRVCVGGESLTKKINFCVDGMYPTTPEVLTAWSSSMIVGSNGSCTKLP